MEPVGPVTGLRSVAVSEWIVSLGCGATPPLSFDPLGSGKSNLVSLVTDANRNRWVLRRPPMGRLAPSAHDIAREHEVLVAVNDSVPTPRVIALTTDPSITDVPLMLLEHVEGLVLEDTEVAERTSPAWRGSLARSVPEALAKVHAVDLEGVGLAQLASSKPYAQRQVKRWQRQWKELDTPSLSGVVGIADRLAANAPTQNETALVHGDFHLRNLILDPDSGAVRAIVDWELCTLGDPLADLGGLLAYWPRPGDDPMVPFSASTLADFPERHELVGTYAEITGRDVGAVAFWQALAYWKIAIIIQGVRVRAARRGTRSPHYDERFVESLLARAEQEIEAYESNDAP